MYWIPVFEILDARGFEVLLVNARDVKHVHGRKSDVNDAQWRQQLLHRHGLLRGSFRPRDSVVRLRAYSRHRERLVDYAAAHIQHMQKALMQMIDGRFSGRSSAGIKRCYGPAGINGSKRVYESSQPSAMKVPYRASCTVQCPVCGDDGFT